LIGTPISIRSLLDALPGDSPTEERGSMIELLPPPLKRAFYKPEDQFANVTFRVLDIGIAKYSTVFERVETGLAKIVAEHPEFRLELAGRRSVAGETSIASLWIWGQASAVKRSSSLLCWASSSVRSGSV